MGRNIVVGIEGPVGSGKTSICREILNRYDNFVLVNGGNIYRAIVYAIMKTGKTIKEIKESKINIKEMMDLYNVTIDFENKETILKLDGTKIKEEDLQSKEVSIAVSEISGSAKNKELFLFARDLIDNLKETKNVLVAGRALMTIYPAIDYHIFVTADLDKRIERKCIQYNVDPASEKGLEIKDNVIKRDALQKESGYYDLSEKTIVVDVTDSKSAEESTDKVLEIFMK